MLILRLVLGPYLYILRRQVRSYTTSLMSVGSRMRCSMIRYAGGTHLRWTFGDQCCVENAELWNSTYWAWSMQEHMSTAKQDPQYLVDWLHGRGGRVFSELHVDQDLANTIPSLRRIEESEAWRQSGCKLFIWTMARCSTWRFVLCCLPSKAQPIHHAGTP